MKVYIDEDTLAVLLEFAEAAAENYRQDGVPVPSDLYEAIAEARRLLRID